MIVSKILNFLGSTFIGSPAELRRKTGLPIRDSFWYLAMDRKLPLNYSAQTMEDLFKEDSFRRWVSGVVATISLVFLLFIGYGFFGNLIPQGAVATKAVANKIGNDFHKLKYTVSKHFGNDEARKARMNELNARSIELADKISKGESTEAEQKEYEEGRAEYNKLKGGK